MNIAIFGTGTVGQTFATRLKSLGHSVMIGTRSVSETLARQEKDGYGNPPFPVWIQSNKEVKVGTFAEAAAFGELIINATMGAVSVQALQAAGSAIEGKVIVDVSNPLDFSKGMPPSLVPALSNTWSLGEELQKTFPNSHIVKTLNTMWCGLMVNPAMIGGGNHTNFICGNSADAKETVKKLLAEFGWSPTSILDLGDISSARGTEAILPVWLRIWMSTQNGAFNLKVVS